MLGMQKRSKTAQVMVAALGGLLLFFLLVGLLVIHLIYPFERPLPFVVGLVLGHGASAAKIVLMDKSINRSLDLGGKHAQNYAGLQAVLRYFLTIGVLLMGVLLRGWVGIFGVVIGILGLQLSAYIANAVLSKHSDLI